MTRQGIQVILLMGATGSGKSSLLDYLRRNYSQRVEVGTKITTRRRRIGDNEWEFRFVASLEPRDKQYSFESIGNHYAIDADALVRVVRSGRVYAISCVDCPTIARLSTHFVTLPIYVFRPGSVEDVEVLLMERGTSADADAELRRKEVISVADDYLEKCTVCEHVILNIGTLEGMIEQMRRILERHGILHDS